MNYFKILLLGVLAVAVLCAGYASAQTYPTKPIHIIVGFGPGGVADLTCRVVAQKLSTQLGQQVLIENRPSAGGIVAADAVAKAAPDGYTLLLLSNGNAVSASLFKSLPYDPVADFAPVSTLGFFDIAMIAKGDAKWNSVKDVLAYAKANPGKLNIGTINIGSTQNLSAELFVSMTGINATIVPYKGSPDVLVALRGNDVQLAFDMLAPIISQFKSGVVKVIAITSERRFSGLPDIPTIAESGVPGYQASSWNAIAAPAKTPRAIIDRLNKEINTALAAAEVKSKLLELGVTARGGTPDALKTLLTSDIAKWRGVIEKAKIEKQ
ncbi:MAG TPA: tripartite tricarboxylate transporter substrate binding protein [Syntrophorhabdales bacterium]|nr:tripartite tricarboxylate transporter substrate binding protein [Syntrophorhabdales bacterium]